MKSSPSARVSNGGRAWPTCGASSSRRKRATPNCAGLLPKSKFHQVLHYHLGPAAHFDNYLNQADARLDNNVAERAIRPLTIWLFVSSEDGGRAAAVLLSLLQICWNLDINPQAHLEDILRRIMGSALRNCCWTSGWQPNSRMPQ